MKLLAEEDRKIIAKLKKQAQSNLNTYSPGSVWVQVNAVPLKRVCEIAEGGHEQRTSLPLDAEQLSAHVIH